MTSAIEARGLVKAYSGNVRALDGLRLEVGEGTIFALLGTRRGPRSAKIVPFPTSRRSPSSAWTSPSRFHQFAASIALVIFPPELLRLS